MTSDDVLEAMKRIEWQKARGHLLAMLETYYSGGDADKRKQFDVMDTRVRVFIKQVEDEL